MELRHLKTTNAERLRSFVKQADIHHYQRDPLFRWENVDEYVLDLIFQFSLRGNVLIALDDDGEIAGFIGFREREWDTKHFGYSVASVDYFSVKRGDTGRTAASLLISEFNAWAQKSAIKFASIKIPLIDEITRTLEESGFYFVGTELTLSKPLPDLNLDGPDDARIRFFSESDMSGLLKIAKNAPWVGRFHTDHNLDKKKSDSLYVRWLENGVQRDNVRVTVLEIDQKPAGFILWSIERLARENKATMVGNQELVAVDPEIRGRGYGKILYRGALMQMQKAGVGLVKTGIAAHNAPALNNQAKLGFHFNDSMEIFHWFRSV